MSTTPFTHRACYVNFAEHLQNRWNVNLLYPDAPQRWSYEDWRAFLSMLKAFGYTCFEYWLVPTLYDRPALCNEGIYGAFARRMQQVNTIAHSLGLRTKYICVPNTIGPSWHAACPRDADDVALITHLWRHWARALTGTDIVGIFPGDPGGCNRNGCTHETFLDLALRLTEITLRENPGARIELGTWGTPFSGWGSDLRTVPGWDGSWSMLTNPTYITPETPMHIWNGTPDRARLAMDALLQRLPVFPADMMVALNLGFSPDGDALMGGDARGYAREVAFTHAITTWDYSLSEGELVTYPHWRLPRMAARRREERSVAPYCGGMHYTMSPKLNVLSLYAGGQFFLNPDADPDQVSRDFCMQVFGAEHALLGELFEAFEVVEGWGYYPRRQWSNIELLRAFDEIIVHLEASDVTQCTLPLFPDPESYRQDVLWFARHFRTMVGIHPDRDKMRQEFWSYALEIYDTIPMSVDVRAHQAADRFAAIRA